MRVSGLEGLETPIAVRVVNQTPSVVRIEGGDSQTVEIRPADGDEEGSSIALRGVVGISACEPFGVLDRRGASRRRWTPAGLCAMLSPYGHAKGEGDVRRAQRSAS